MILSRSATAMALIVAAGPVWAELTPDQLWDNLRRYYESGGLIVESGEILRDGDRMEVPQLVLRREAPEGNLRVELGDLVLRSTGDGAVRVEPAAQAELTADFPAGSAEAESPEGPSSLRGTIQYPDTQITAREDGDRVVYDYAVPRISGEMQAEFLEDGEQISLPLSIEIENIRGSDRVGTGEALALDQSFAADALRIGAELPGENGEPVDLDLQFAGVEAQGRASAPSREPQSQDMAAMLRDGFELAGRLSFATAEALVRFQTETDEGEVAPGEVTARSEGSTLNFSLAANGMMYQAAADTGAVEATMPELDTPVAYSFGPTTLDLQMPVTAGEQPQRFKFAFGLSEAQLSDETWALFDQQGALPREAAEIDIDVTGTALLDRDLFDPALAADIAPTDDPALSDEERDARARDLAGESMPGSVQSVDINQVALSLLGASVRMQGSLAAPEGGTLQQPVGEVTARYEGLNALIETLANAGIVPAEQLMGLRMGLAMFATPSAEGGDVAETALEFREDGSVFANGQQVK